LNLLELLFHNVHHNRNRNRNLKNLKRHSKAKRTRAPAY